MAASEKRRHDRISSINLLNYVYFDENGQEQAQGMGRTLNVSESGILLETRSALDQHHRVSIHIGLEDEMVDIKGKVIFNKKNQSNMFESGIEFEEIGESPLAVLKKYIAAFKAL
jgi:hypothetical protein